MLSISYSSMLNGIDAVPIRIETDVSNGLPGMEMVGYLSSEVKEAKERVRIAIKNSGYEFSTKKITVNLSPADIRKSGTQYDLAIAIGMLVCESIISQDKLNDLCILGELKLNGEVSPVNGVISYVIDMMEKGFKRIMIPVDNLNEAKVIDGIEIIPVSSLTEAVSYFNGEYDQYLFEKNIGYKSEKNEDFLEVKGQYAAKRAAEITAAGFHNLLLCGPPGAGKSMIAKRIPGIMPPLLYSEQIQLTRIYSSAGKLDSDGLISKRPFREPHHSITKIALAGGGRVPRPGEISYADFGILFMDEFPEFNRDVIEILRQPLENHTITINRINGSVEYPADFTLVAAMNRCPCGFYPDMKKCRCTQTQIKRYLSKISQPILDRIDLMVSVTPIKFEEMDSKTKSESSASIYKRIKRAREMQEKRYEQIENKYNSRLSSKETEEYCKIKASSKALLRETFSKRDISARSYYRILKTSRTIADLEGCEEIQDRHVMEALMYRIDSLYEV